MSATSLMASIDRFSSWKVKPPTLRTELAMRWLAAAASGWPSDHAVAPARRSMPRNPLASRRRPPVPRSVSDCSASPSTSRGPANEGSIQLMEGWPSLK